MNSFSSYPSIFNMGHKAIQDLLKGDVLVEEKVDGSQFSFGLVESNLDTTGKPVDPVWNVFKEKCWSLKVRSKGCVMHIDAPEKMFNKAVTTVKELVGEPQNDDEFGLHPGWTYRGEYLAKPKHNALAYDRVPKGHIIIFDINTGDQEFLGYDEKAKEAERIGLEVVPRLFEGRISEISEFRRFLESVSILGGQKIEGVVVKPILYNLYGLDHKVLMGKLVSEQYREIHSLSWKADNPSVKDIIGRIGESYCTAGRWAKAVTHLRERGLINDDVSDIGPLIREVPEDVKKECEDEIKELLFAHSWPHIRRLLTRGLPDWYKQSVLLPKAFENEAPVSGKPDAHLGCVTDDC